MSKRILILDDDRDFTELLTDIFKQSRYDTVPENDPVRALERLRSEHFDMLVTDHRMPGMTGELLVRELRTSHPRLPVVVVSGCLDNDTIRSLIRDGVGGIFMKPLNIVNLLKRTAMLMDEADQRDGRAADPDAPEQPSLLPFPFETFPCRSPKSVEFALALKAKTAFRAALTLACPTGTPVKTLLRDLESLDETKRARIRLISNRNISEEYIREQLRLREGEGRLPVLAFQNLDHADEASREIVIRLGKHAPPFADLRTPPPLVFIFTQPVDELYERGKLEEPLYLLASITELKVPRLAECPDDIPILATRYIREHCESVGINPAPHIHKSAKTWLRDLPWEGNAEELRSRCLTAISLSDDSTLTRENFELARSEQQWPGGPVEVRSLHEYLTRLRDDHIHAALLLCDFDTTMAAQTLGVAKGMLDTHPIVTPKR